MQKPDKSKYKEIKAKKFCAYQSHTTSVKKRKIQTSKQVTRWWKVKSNFKQGTMCDVRRNPILCMRRIIFISFLYYCPGRDIKRDAWLHAVYIGVNSRGRRISRIFTVNYYRRKTAALCSFNECLVILKGQLIISYSCQQWCKSSHAN